MIIAQFCDTDNVFARAVCNGQGFSEVITTHSDYTIEGPNPFEETFELMQTMFYADLSFHFNFFRPLYVRFNVEPVVETENAKIYGETYLSDHRTVVDIYCAGVGIDIINVVVGHEFGHIDHYFNFYEDFMCRTDFGRELWADDYAEAYCKYSITRPYEKLVGTGFKEGQLYDIRSNGIGSLEWAFST